ncbi:MAG: MMPL family transporter [Actinobacteria bacterium]|nr:MMPL family transporter [Actinomycetota bacterium]
MFARIAAMLVHRRRAVLIAALLGFIAAGAMGGDVQEHLSVGGFDDPESESTRAAEVLEEHFAQGIPNLVLLVESRAGSVDDVAAEGQSLTERVADAEHVAEAASYWSLGNPPPLRSGDGSKALVLARIEGTQSEQLERAGELREEFTYEDDTFSVSVGGFAATFDEINQIVEEDLVKAELIVFPLTFVLLIIVFGGVVAALLPLGVGGFAIVGTFFVLKLIAQGTEVSIFALNFTTAMGLGLAIDYALLVVSRFREELAAGYDTATAVSRTVQTAGRTVLFSGLTVAAALAALLVFRFAFLRSFAYAGMAVVGLAVVGAVVVLPAGLAVLGPRVNKWQVRKRAARPEHEEGTWHRIAMAVMRRPIPIATVVMVFLTFLGLPFLGVELGFPDDRVLPPGAETREVGDTIRAEFNSNEAVPVQVVVPGVDARDRGEDVDAYATALSQVDGVARVDAATGSYLAGFQVFEGGPLSERFVAADATYLSVVLSEEPISLEGEEIVRDVRAVDAPFEQVLVGGGSAELVDGKAGLLGQMPLALALIAAITFIVLFLMFGSILVPFKAIALNLFSLTATFGAMVWVFQDGNLSGLLGFTATGTLVTTMPVLMFCVAFGLSMDYEVFMLSRIKEEYDRSGDNVGSVASGLEHTGRIVTAAAVLIAVVFAAFSTGRVSFIKLFGIGMALAVLVDAFLIRATLVPAFMRLAGRANWWAPGPLRRLHERIGLSESVDLDDTPPTSEASQVGVSA